MKSAFLRARPQFRLFVLEFHPAFKIKAGYTYTQINEKTIENLGSNTRQAGFERKWDGLNILNAS